MRLMPVILLPKNKKTGIYRKILRQSSAVLKKGGVIVAPTDTIYGFLAMATDKNAVEKVQKIKGRNKKKPMPVLARDIVQVKRFARVSSKAASFIQKVWPGPYTLVFKAKGKLPSGVVAYNGSIGMRVPDNGWLRDLIGETGGPLIATSANISSRPEIKNTKQAIKEFARNKICPDMMVSGGTISAKPSVVIDMRVWPPKVLRGTFGNIKSKPKQTR